MKRAILAVCAVLAALPAMATNWVNITESSSTVMFHDTHSIKIDGENRRVWELGDRKVSGTNGARSDRTLVEYDCKEARIRFLQTTDFRGQMATGAIISMSTQPQPWAYVAPGTTGDELFKAACKFVP